MFLPTGEVVPIQRAESDADVAADVAGSEAQDSTELLSPFKDVQLDRARARAQEILDEFTAMQDQVEVNMLGSHDVNERYRAILDRADQGDIHFANREFDVALQAYETALAELGSYVSDMNNTFMQLMTAANEMLDERDEDAARKFFNEAGDVKPLDVQVQAGLRRVELLPEVNRLLLEGRRAALRQEWREAAEYLAQVREKDPLTKGLDELDDEIRDALRQQEFNNQLSRAHAALAGGDFDAAETLFTIALSEAPGNSAAQTGLEQTARARTLATIEGLRTDAATREANLDFRGALEVYDKILEIDKSLQFAREGKERVHVIVSVTQAINRVLSDPEMLSSDDEFVAAKAVLANAENHRGFSPQYDSRLTEFENVLEEASLLLPLILLSDEMTEIRLTTVGNLGTFMRHEVQLRPGRYEVVGSSDGCVDVRKTITVRRDMKPISIVCEDPIY